MQEINLLAPAGSRRRVQLPPLRVTAVAVSIVVIAALAVWSFLLITRVNHLREDLARGAQEVARLQPLDRHVQELSRDAEQLRLRSALLQQMAAQMPASQILETIRSAIPRDVGLTSLTVGEGSVALEGYALAYPPLERFMVELENSGGVRHVGLSSSQRGIVANREVVKFQITADLVAPHPVSSHKEPAP